MPTEKQLSATDGWTQLDLPRGWFEYHVAPFVARRRAEREVRDDGMTWAEFSEWVEHQKSCPDGCELCKPDRRHVRDSISERTRAAVYERDGYRCLTCGAEANLSLDHVKPWSKGGSDQPENLQTLCMPCNLMKGAKRLDDLVPFLVPLS